MENQQELLFKLSMFEQQIRQLQEQIGAVEKAVLDLQNLNQGLEDFSGIKDKEVFAHVGRGIFVKAKIISEDLLVDVGEQNFVKKDLLGTRKILGEQIKKLQDIQKELENNLEKTSEEINNMISESEKD